jgi:membrane protein
MTATSDSAHPVYGRGRRANSPTEIPPIGWKDVVWRIYGDITENRILLIAAGVSFYLLLSLVPTLTAFVSLYGLFNDRASVLEHVQLLSGVVPAGVLSVLEEQLTRLTSQPNDTLGWTLIVALALALWSASAGVKAMFDAMNVAYHETEKRSFLVFNGMALLFTFAGAVAAVLVLAVVVVMPALVSLVPGQGLEWVVRIGSYAVMLVVLSLMIAGLYRWGPSRQQARWRWITPGVLVSVVALGIGSVGFSWYVANFSDDNAAYGSLGAVIGLMTWLWISSTLVIIGAVLNSEIEHQTVRDSTTGERAPLGKRGAFVADTVGETWPEGDDDKTDVPRRSRRERKRVSWGTLAFAAPAALALVMAQRRDRK